MPHFNPIIWFGLGILLLGFEVLFPKSVLIWFGISAMLTSILLNFQVLINYLGEWIFFLLFAIFLLLLWRLLLKKVLKIDLFSSYYKHSIYHIPAKVIKRIEPSITGEVELEEEWAGQKIFKAKAFKIINCGEQVIILEHKNDELLVDIHFQQQSN